MADNNRGNTVPHAPGTDQPAASPSQVISVDTSQYAPERTPKGYLRVATVPENTDPC